jgi:molybdopterin-containing oxidoreductase family membrane subunit
VHLKPFALNALHSATTGGRRHWIWMAFLAAIMMVGAYCYYLQLRYGLGVTGMNDQVSWGLYISNFTFLVGMAAASIMLVLPAYILHDVDFGRAVLIAQAVAAAALVMCLAFVVVDIGNPFGSWHLVPIIGYLNWPKSLLAWDVPLLNGYLAINIGLPFYFLYSRFQGHVPDKRKYLPWMYISVGWAVGLHVVTAFLLAGLPARPFWNDALLGPRFLASAFTAGPAGVIILLWLIRRHTHYDISDAAFSKLGLITAVAAQINLDMLGSELFYKFYAPTRHGISAQYLFFGLKGHHALVPWIWTAIAMNTIATVSLMFHPIRKNTNFLIFDCALLFVAIWIEKGMGLVVPGFIPSPLGEIVEYHPTGVEIGVTAGIWALGLMVLTVLVRIALPIELGEVRSPFVTGDTVRPNMPSADAVDGLGEVLPASA